MAPTFGEDRDLLTLIVSSQKQTRGCLPPRSLERCHSRGRISLAGFAYAAGATFAGGPVEVVAIGGLVDIFHAGVLIATHAQRLKPDQADRIGRRALVPAPARDATTGLTVTQLADGSGTVSFAGSAYAGRGWARASIEASTVAGSVQLASSGTVIRVHPIRHDRSRELGAFATPKGLPPA